MKVRFSSSSTLYCLIMMPFSPGAFLFFAFFNAVFNLSMVMGTAIAVLTGIMDLSLLTASGSKAEFLPKFGLLKNSPWFCNRSTGLAVRFPFLSLSLIYLVVLSMWWWERSACNSFDDCHAVNGSILIFSNFLIVFFIHFSCALLIACLSLVRSWQVVAIIAGLCLQSYSTVFVCTSVLTIVQESIHF